MKTLDELKVEEKNLLDAIRVLEQLNTRPSFADPTKTIPCSSPHLPRFREQLAELQERITVQTALEFVTGGWYFGQFHGRESIFDISDVLYDAADTPELVAYLRAREEKNG